MSNVIKASDQQPEYEVCPSGSHVARIIRVVDLGTQEMQKWEAPPGVMEQKGRILLMFELPLETILFKDKDGVEKEMPRVISKEYTKSMYETSGLRLDLEAWAGKKFTQDQVNEFNVNTICGKTLMVNVVHSSSKDGSKTYANVKGLASMPKGMTCPDAVNAVFTYEIEEGVGGHFEELPKWVQDKILKAKEWEADSGSSGVSMMDNGAGLRDTPVGEWEPPLLDPVDTPF